MAAPATSDDLAEVVRHELYLLRGDIRARPELVLPLLHPDFVEYGASGRAWSRDSVTAAMAPAMTPAQLGARDVQAVALAEDVVLVTYVSDEDGARRCLRSSTWVRGPGGAWMMRFHQGTVCADQPDAEPH